ncbi:MAG: hypothetical protein ChlgKO_10370 [Chlamydiales bacterium]
MHTYKIEGAHPYSLVHLGLESSHVLLPEPKSHEDQLIVWNLETGEHKIVNPNFHSLQDRIPLINESHTVVYLEEESLQSRRFNDIFSSMKYRANELLERESRQNVPRPPIDNCPIEEDSEMAKSLLNTAENYARKNKNYSAIESFEEALAYTHKAEDYKRVCDFFAEEGTDKEKELAYLYLAILYYRENNYAQANQALSAAQLSSKNVKTTLLYADYLYSRENYRHAVGYYNTAALKLEQKPRLRANVLRKIICCEPDEVDSYKRLADVYENEKSKFWIYLLAFVHFYEKNQFEKYTQFNKLASEKEPSNPLIEIIHLCLAENSDRLDSELENSLSIAAGQKLMKKNRHEEARHYFIRAAKSNNDKDFEDLIICDEFSPEGIRENRIASTYINWAKACEENKRFDKALEVYEEALGRLPNNAEIHLKYLRLLLSQKNPVHSEAILKEVRWCNENIHNGNKSRNVTAIRGDINFDLSDKPEEAFYRNLITENHELFTTFFAENELRHLYQGWIEHHQTNDELLETIAVAKTAIERFPNHVPYRLNIAKLLFQTKNRSETPYLLEQISWLEAKKEIPEAKERISRLFNEMFQFVESQGIDAFIINLISENEGLFQKIFAHCEYARLFNKLFDEFIDSDRYVEALEISRTGLNAYPENLEFRKKIFEFIYNNKGTELIKLFEEFTIENCRAILAQCSDEEKFNYLKKLYETAIVFDLAVKLAKIYKRANNLKMSGHIFYKTAIEAAKKKNYDELKVCIREINDITLQKCGFDENETTIFTLLSLQLQEHKDREKDREEIREELNNIIDQLPQPGWIKQIFQGALEMLRWKKPKEEAVN